MARAYLGVGTSYPTTISAQGSVNTIDDSALIQQSINIILNTRVGTYEGNPNFGSEIETVLFEQNDVILRSLLDTFVKEALARWERRITVVSVSFEEPESDPSILNVIILASIKARNEIESFVYPFYRQLNY